jgi:hypothetical protein
VIPGSGACLVAGEPAATVCWRSSAATERAGRRTAVAGHLMAADAEVAADSAVEVADVIVSARSRPPAWTASVLNRYPGCAVAVGRIPSGGYLAAARGGRPLTLSFLMQNKPGFSDAANGALACAVFVHAWLAAGWPLDALDPPCLLATEPWPTKPMLGVPLPFVLYYKESSTRWMSSAWGAPASE